MKPRPTHGVAHRLARFRERMGLTLTEAADRIGISVSFLSDIELERRRPSAEVIIRMAQAYADEGMHDAELWRELAAEELETARRRLRSSATTRGEP